MITSMKIFPIWSVHTQREKKEMFIISDNKTNCHKHKIYKNTEAALLSHGTLKNPKLKK